MSSHITNVRKKAMKFQKLVIVALLVLVLGSVAYTVAAQNANPQPPAGCNVDTLTALADTFQKAHNDAVKAIEAGDLTTAMTSLSSTNAQVAELQAVCDGLSFSGKKDEVIGPVQIPAGTYRARATTTGFIIVDVTATDGECGAGSYMSSGLFSLSKGDANDGAEAIFTSNDCTALIEVSLVQAAWTLTFEKVG
jgi:hypothetical protein